MTVTSITVTPNGTPNIHDVGDTLQMTAIANFSNGTTANITATAQWSAPGANITPTGLLSGKGTPASAVVTATSGGVSGQTTVVLRQAIYILDANAGKVIRVDDMNGSGFIAVTPSTPFSQPESLAVDTRGRIDVADPGGAIFGVVQLTGINNNQARIFDNGSPGAIDPLGIAVDNNDRIYWTDIANPGRPIFRIDDINGTNITSFVNPTFGVPSGIFVDDTMHIFITDQNNSVHRVDDMTGSGLKTLTHGNINFPYSMWIDAQGRLFIADVNNLTVDRFDSIAGGNLASFSTTISGSTGPVFVAVDAQGRVYYTQDTLAGRQLVRVDDMTGANPVTLSGTPIAVDAHCVYIR